MIDFNSIIKELENEIDKIDDSELLKYEIYGKKPKSVFSPKNY